VSTESASTKAGSAGDDEPVPKLPRGRGMKLSGPQIARIAMTLVTLIGVMFLAKPCANAVSNFVMSYEQGSGSAMPKPGNVDMPVGTGQYEQLRPGMSEAEIKAAMERARAKQRGGVVEQDSAAPAGSAAPGAGSAAPASGSAALPDPAPPSTTTQPSTTP
jgi:hypothetical protein